MKKLKGLGPRAYNTLFHTHTVAGIVISFGLFIIFYAGAYTLFYHELKQWENPDLRQPMPAIDEVDYDLFVQKVDEAYNLDYTKRVNVYFPSEHEPIIKMYAQGHTSDSTTESVAVHYSHEDQQIHDAKEEKTTLGNTIYGLHYFHQIPFVGLYLAGFVALFFLFASVTGILIHWRNLLTKFYSFIKEGKWKLIWTNAHTVLGVIGLPFQVMYAITGAFFGLLVLILLPAVFLKYDGDVEKVYGKIIPFYGVEVNEEAPASDNYTIVDLFKQVKADYPDHTFTRTQILNYGKEDALILFALDDAEEIHAAGSIVMNMKSGEVVEKYSQFPQKRTYSYAVVDYIFKLHFASFGGFFMKLVYFVMAMITAFMIISGVLLWREARNNNRYTYKQKLFHHRVTKAYLAICLGLFPAFGVLFLANKLVPWEMEGRAELVEQIFLLGWLLLTIMGLFWNKYSQQNRNYLIIGGVLSILIPIANGVMTGGWIWNMWGPYPWVAYVDMFWLFAGLTALLLSLFVLKVKDDSDKPKPPVEKVKPKEERLPVPEKIMTPNPLKELVLKFKSLRSTGA